MKALVVCEPMASALIFGGKVIENRRRSLGHVGPVLIVAGLSLDWFTPEICAWTHERWPECPANPVGALHAFKARLGRAIGIGYMHGPKDHGFSSAELQWKTGPVCHPFVDPRPITPFKVRGMQGVFTVPAAAIPPDAHAAFDELVQLHGR